MTSQGNGETRKLARFAAGIKYDDIPSDVIKMAKWHTLNILGSTLRGHTLESPQIIIRGYKGMGGRPDSTVIGENVKLPAPIAAGINAHSAYSTMNDDTFYEGVFHPGHAVITASLAVGEKEKSSGKDYLTAVVTGFELGCRVAASLTQSQESHKSRLGWHCNIADAFCSVGAAGKLLKFDEDLYTAGIGIAATSSSGLLETEYPTYVWAWDGGKANYLGVLGSYFAKDGMDAGETALEGLHGYVTMYTGGNPPPEAFPRLTRGFGSEWMTSRISIKTRCCSYMVHAVVDAAQKAALGNGVKPQEIESITLKQTFWLELRLMRMDIEDYNTTVFSTPYAIGVAIVDGKPMTLPDQMAAHLKDPLVREIMGKVRAEIDPEMEKIFGHQMPAIAIVRTNDGRVFEERVDYTVGSYPQRPLTEEQHLFKFRTNAGHSLSSKQMDHVIDAVNNLENMKDIGELAELVK